MNTPSQSERLAFWSDTFARSSFIQAKAFAELLLSSNIPLYSVPRDVFTTAILAVYCRPFKQRSSVKLKEDIIPTEHQFLHESLIIIRDKVVSHRDRGTDADDWKFINEVHINVKDKSLQLDTISPKLQDNQVKETIILIDKLIPILDARISPFVKKYLPRIAHSDGTYSVSLDENPSEWLIKK